MKQQIEEMARIMLEKSKSANAEPIFTAEDGTEIVLDEKSLKLIDVILEQAYIPFLAEVLYNAGYRKQCEVERLQSEIAKLQLELHYSVCREDETAAITARRVIEEIYEDCFDQFGFIDYDALDELYKKYSGATDEKAET